MKLIIFRLPDEDGEKRFTALSFYDGKLATEGKIFSVNPGDSYNEMGFYHVVVADSTEGGSIDLCRYAIDDKAKDDAVVHEFSYDDLTAVAEYLIKTYHKE